MFYIVRVKIKPFFIFEVTLDYNIGEKIKELRKARQLTLQAVANETGFSPALISQIENNNVSPPIATLSKIARFFEVKISHFFEEEEDPRRFEVVRIPDRRVVSRVISKAGPENPVFLKHTTRRRSEQIIIPIGKKQVIPCQSRKTGRSDLRTEAPKCPQG